MAEGKGHTELPWHVSGKQSIRGPNGEYVAKANWRDGFENASFIVTAVNTYPAVEGLVKALEACRRELNIVRGGSTDGIPNAIIACIPEAVELADSAISRFRSLQNGGAND